MEELTVTATRGQPSTPLRGGRRRRAGLRIARKSSGPGFCWLSGDRPGNQIAAFDALRGRSMAQHHLTYATLSEESRSM